ncbi:Fungalysin metallopeptidase-domain-containing protein [Coemansia spiralis]|nr:Fungalysin metallopeptidase-domain-containing protein [Coemansia spiralis]
MPNTTRITDAYSDEASGVTHVYLKQVVEEFGVANGLANVNIDQNGHVISSSHSFAPQLALPAAGAVNFGSTSGANSQYKHIKLALQSFARYTFSDIDPQIIDDAVSFTDAFRTAAGDSGFVVSGLPGHVVSNGQCGVARELLQLAGGQVIPVWHMTMQQPMHWWSAYIGVEDGQVHSISDWAYKLEAYSVLPHNISSPTEGSPQLLTNPAYTPASPFGWVTRNTTIGNNVWAQTNPTGNDTWIGNYRPVSSAAFPNKVFDFPLNTNSEPSTYADFSVTQLFYTVNTMHDLAFVYGFNEEAGNFQDINYSGKGTGGDYIVAFAQDGGSTNNANFMSPPDGQHGLMRMYLWSETTPRRDGNLDQSIVAHEFTHGISSRLTGGPSNADCLNSGEPGGMGEGWSDAVAFILYIKPGQTRMLDVILGEYVYGKNIRQYPYSTNMSTNPQTYKDLDKEEYKEVHAVGQVWASMLYEVMWSLIDSNGISGDLFDHDLSKGNSIMLQILLNGMKLQPCNPSFIDARNAILQAERTLSRGKNECAIWHGFSKRGLGVGAFFNNTAHTEDYSVPQECN